MPIPVTCACGKKFSAKEEHAGKRLKCPACGGAIAVPGAPQGAGQPGAAQPTAAQPAALAQSAPAQSAPTDPLFSNDPLGGGPLDLGGLGGGPLDAGAFGGAPASMPGPTQPAAGQYAAAGARPAPAAGPGRPAAAAEGMDFGTKLALFGGGAAIVVLGGAFCLYAAITSFSTPVAQNPLPPINPNPPPAVTPGQPSQPVSPPPGFSPSIPDPLGTANAGPNSAVPGSAGTPGAAPPPAFPPAFPPASTPGATPTPGSTPPSGPIPLPGVQGYDASGRPILIVTLPPGTQPSGAAGGAPGGASPSRPLGGTDKPLPGGVLGWHGQAGAPLAGAKPVKGEELYVYQYSWLCDVLPFLGYDKLYNEFDFKRPWTDDPNRTRARLIIPQFINPNDPRLAWRGYHFQGGALTHFAGISGIEDSRNVVAAELPRSDPRAGIFGYRSVARQDEITDGASNTLMMIGSGELVGLWVQGGGATIRGAREPYFDKLTGFGSRGAPEPGAMAMLADGSVRFIPATIDPKVFRALCTIHGSDTVDLAPLGEPLPDFPGKR